MSVIFSVWTVVVLILFIGIVLWAWSGRNKERFDAAARLPFDEEGGGEDLRRPARQERAAGDD